MSDEEAIRALLGRYVEAADGDDPDGFAALFAPDGVLEIEGSPVVAGVFVGRDAIRERMGGGRSTRRGSRFRHHLSSVRVDATGRSAAYFVAMTTEGADHWGHYEDRLVHGVGGWAFAHRRVTIDGAASFSRLQPVG